MRSYRTVSPLPPVTEAAGGGLFSVALSLGSPPAAVNRHHVSKEPGLSSVSARSTGHNAHVPTAAIRPTDGCNRGVGRPYVKPLRDKI